MNHDQNFKNLILDYPRQALEFFAAEEMELFDGPLRITPVRQEQLKHRLKERHRELDVPLLVEWPSGNIEMILFALEEETQSSRFSIHRLAHYCIDLGEMFKVDRIIPVVIFLNKYHGTKTLHYASETRTYLQFNFLYCELATIPWQHFRASSNIVARLNLPNMMYPKGDKVDVYASAMQGLFQLEHTMDKQFKYLDFVDLYTNLSNNEKQQYNTRYPEEAHIMSNFADRFIAQGVEQGIQQGMQQGMQQRDASFLLRLLESKFGPVTSGTKRRVETADVETLVEWSEKLFTAKSPEDLWH